MAGSWLAVILAVAGVALVWFGRGGRSVAVYAGLTLLGAAAARMVVWESYPDVLGGAMAPLWLRAVGYSAVIGGFVGAGSTARTGRVRWALCLCAWLVGLWWITFEATHAIEAGRGQGHLAGNEAMLVAGGWGLYGLLLAALERRFRHENLRHMARLTLGAALICLTLWALPSTARWAYGQFRAFGYTAVLGAAWVAEALWRRHGEDREVEGIVAMAAGGATGMVAAFESRLWLDVHLFMFEQGAVRSAESLAGEASVRAYATAGAWGLCAVAVAAVGFLLLSPRTRLVAAGMFGVALAYTASAALAPGAPLALQLAALAVVTGGALRLSWLARRASGCRHPWEDRAYRWLPWAAAGVAALWGAMKLTA
ncbi:MAG TPA: hypothetical protein VD969_05890 [Symbiobacteriaceae bacterium]|nr:hypothetical protein [Symbiobacteriaceae bacterium]